MTWRRQIQQKAQKAGAVLAGDYFFHVVLPLAAFTIAYLAMNWQRIGVPLDPVGDNAINALQVARARQFREYLGAYSRYGFHHPGPIAFYSAAAVEALLFFLPWGYNKLFIANLLLKAGFLFLALHACYRMLKPALSTLLLAGAVLYVIFPQGAAALLYDWGPIQIILPMVAFIPCAAALAQGKIRYILPVTVAGMFIGQTHIGGLPVVVPLALLAVVLGVIRQIRGRRRLDRRDRVYLAVTAVFFVCALLPPLYEQFTASYGNLSRLYDFYAGNGVRGYALTAQDVPHSLAAGFSIILPFYTQVGARIIGERLQYLALGLLIVSVALQCGGRENPIRRLVLFLLLGCALSIVAAARIIGPLLPYLVLYEYAFSAFWVMLFLRGVYRGLDLVRRRLALPRPWIPRWPLFRALFLIAVIVTVVQRHYLFDLGRSQFVGKAVELIAPRRDRTYFLWWLRGSSSHAQWAPAAGLAYRLSQEGYDVCVAEGWWEFMFGPEMICDPLPANTYPVFLSLRGQAATPSYEKILQVETTTLEAGYPPFPFVLRHNAGETFFWGWAEASAEFRKSERLNPQLFFFVKAGSVPYATLDLRLRCGGYADRPVTLSLNGTVIGKIQPAGWAAQDWTFSFPASIIKENAINVLAFQIPAAASGETPGALPEPGLAFYELRLQPPALSRPTWRQGENWHAEEYHDGRLYQWISNDAVLLLYAPHAGRYQLSFSAHGFYDYRHLELLLDGEVIADYTVAQPAQLTASLSLPEGWSEMVLHVREGCASPRELGIGDDPRCVSVGIGDLRFAEAPGEEDH